MTYNLSIRRLLLLSLSGCLLLVLFNLRESLTGWIAFGDENFAYKTGAQLKRDLRFSWKSSHHDSVELTRNKDPHFSPAAKVVNQDKDRVQEGGEHAAQGSNSSSLLKEIVGVQGKIEPLIEATVPPLKEKPEKNQSQSKARSIPLKKLADEDQTRSDRKESQNKESTTPKRKPMNVLILYPDDWRHDCLGAAGTYPVKTPFLDTLANEGIRFTHNCVTTSVCWISRATLFTGQYMSRHRSDDTINPVFYTSWNETWPQLLRNAGYHTGHIGKWQFSNYSFVEEQFNYTYLLEGYHWVDNPQWQPGQPKYIHTTDIYENTTIDFIKNRPKDRPFALTVAFYAPKAIGFGKDQWFPKNETLKQYENVTIPEPLLDGNTSFAKLPEFFKKTEYSNAGRTRWVDRFGSGPQYQYSMRRYFALITEVDNAIKGIYKELENQGILNDTLLIFTTDNGFFLGEHGLGGKWWPYQESIRVPLIIRDPRMPRNKVGTLDDSFTLNIDLAPTILDAANIKVPAGMQGRNIADLYVKPEAKQSWRKEFYYEHPTHYGVHFIPSSSALVRKDFKYMVYPDWNVTQLFDLKTDPFEYEDLVNNSDYRELVVQMRKRHDELQQEVLKPVIL